MYNYTSESKIVLCTFELSPEVNDQCHQTCKFPQNSTWTQTQPLARYFLIRCAPVTHMQWACIILYSRARVITLVENIDFHLKPEATPTTSYRQCRHVKDRHGHPMCQSGRASSTYSSITIWCTSVQGEIPWHVIERMRRGATWSRTHSSVTCLGRKWQLQTQGPTGAGWLGWARPMQIAWHSTKYSSLKLYSGWDLADERGMRLWNAFRKGLVQYHPELSI